MYNKYIFAGVMELADVTDSKSVGSDTVPVRVRPPAPLKSLFCPITKETFLIISVPIGTGNILLKNVIYDDIIYIGYLLLE